VHLRLDVANPIAVELDLDFVMLDVPAVHGRLAMKAWAIASRGADDKRQDSPTSAISRPTPPAMRYTRTGVNSRV
jgi:hypothetical protein